MASSYGTKLKNIYLIDGEGNRVEILNNLTTINLEEEINVEKKLNKFIEDNNIKVDENGNFEMYVVVDINDKDHEVGSVFHGSNKAVYAKDKVYDRLKINMAYGGLVSHLSFNTSISSVFYGTPSNLKIDKKTTIKEDLLTMKDKLFKILVNKENVTDVNINNIIVNKYKVIENIELNPKLKYKIKSIENGKSISVILYNDITEKSKSLDINYSAPINMLQDVHSIIVKYLDENEKQVALINSIVENGSEL
jgi:hypothetical protein